jgi:hypothetical protein
LESPAGQIVLKDVPSSEQGCQMVCFQTKNPNFGKFWMVLQWKMLVYFMDTWSIVRSFVIPISLTFGIVHCNLVYCFPFWYFVPRKIWQPCRRKFLRERFLVESSSRSTDFQVQLLLGGNPGVDATSTIFKRLSPFFGEKNCVFLKSQCYDNNLKRF